MLEYIVGTIGTAVLAVFGWAFNLNSRAAVLESQHDNLLLLIESKFDDQNRRLDRIERACNGYLGSH